MSGWVVELCSCGFNGGDWEQEFDTREEVVDYVAWNGQQSDASILSITAPDGKKWSATRLYEKIVVP